MASIFPSSLNPRERRKVRLMSAKRKSPTAAHEKKVISAVWWPPAEVGPEYRTGADDRLEIR